MSQDTFGLIILGGILVLCTGMTIWAEWSNVKTWCSKHGLIRSH
jgi:hypothetical protein